MKILREVSSWVMMQKDFKLRQVCNHKKGR